MSTPQTLPPCPSCVSEYGRPDPSCRFCGGSGVCPSVPREAIHPAQEMEIIKEWRDAVGCASEWSPSSSRWADRVIKAGADVVADLQRVQEDNHRLRAALGDVCDALGTLRREAHGFLSMASDETHGVTNKRVLKLRIDEAYLAEGKAQALASERTD